MAWSPDGAQIAYATNEIWVMHADGSAPRQFTHTTLPTVAGCPLSWRDR